MPDLIMENNKSILQKSAVFFAVASFIASIASVIFLYLKIDDLGWQNLSLQACSHLLSFSPLLA